MQDAASLVAFVEARARKQRAAASGGAEGAAEAAGAGDEGDAPAEAESGAGAPQAEPGADSPAGDAPAAEPAAADGPAAPVPLPDAAACFESTRHRLHGGWAEQSNMPQQANCMPLCLGRLSACLPAQQSEPVPAPRCCRPPARAGMVHANGYSHLLRVNGREGGSRTFTGAQLMDLWDGLCTALRVRACTTEDVSNKVGWALQLLWLCGGRANTRQTYMAEEAQNMVVLSGGRAGGQWRGGCGASCRAGLWEEGALRRACCQAWRRYEERQRSAG